MIQSLHLKNCQSHKDTKIVFHPGLNVIVGDTDSGKSAIIRGLEKVLYNNIPSKELISHWSKTLEIEIKVDDKTISIIHDKKDSFKLNKILFSAINSKVPSEIQDVFNMEDINLQTQSENYFLLNETSGFVASYLNKIANLEQIDSAIKTIKSELNETKRTIEHDKKGLKEKEIELTQFDFLPELESKIKELDKLESNKVEIQLEVDSIAYLLKQLKQIKSKIKLNLHLIKLKDEVDSSLHLFNILELELKNHTKLNSLIERLDLIDSDVKELNNTLTLKTLIDSVISEKQKLSILTTKLESLNSIIDKVSNIDKKVKFTMSNQLKEQKIYNSKIKELDVCFFCGSKLN